MDQTLAAPLSPDAFEQALKDKGAYYHIHYPYHIAMHNGQATRAQIQGCAANRFYCQVSIPLKDAAIMANCPDPAVRRQWIQRILDHDGHEGQEGGMDAWLRLGRRSIWRRRNCCRSGGCCQGCVSRWTPMLILPAALAGKKRPAAR